MEDLAIVPLDDAASLATTINTYTGGPGATGDGLSASASVDGNTVTVTGTIENASTELTLAIDSGVTVLWKASLTTEPADSADPFLLGVINLYGGSGGVFEVAEGGALIGEASVIISSRDSTRIVVSDGGEVQNTKDYGIAIRAGKVDVTGGLISHTGDFYAAIASTTANGEVNISGGTVESHGADSDAVSVTGDNSALNISGGTVLASGDSTNAVYTGVGTGITVTLSDTGKLEAAGGTGICMDSTSPSLMMTGGEIDADIGIDTCCDVTIDGGTIHARSNGIMCMTNDIDIVISGGKILAGVFGIYSVVSPSIAISGGTLGTTASNAIYTTGINASVAVSGDALVFGFGDGIASDDSSSSDAVIYMRDATSLFTAPTGDGIVLNWKKSAAPSDLTYVSNSTDDILTSPSGSLVQAYWAWQLSEVPIGGIAYQKGANPGFLPIDDIVVTGGTAPLITTSTLPNGTRGAAYSQTVLATGTVPITRSIDSGTLPPGLTLSATGVIAGVPTATGTFTFTVKAANGINPDDTKQLSITVTGQSGGGGGGGMTTPPTTTSPGLNTTGGALGNGDGSANRISIRTATVTTASRSLRYTGSALRPAIQVVLNGKTLTPGVDYSVTYKDNTVIGTALVTVHGEGSYIDGASAIFSIVPTRTGILRLTPTEGKLKVQWKKVPAVQKVTNYQVRYRAAGSSKWYVRTVKSNISVVTLQKRLMKNKRYYVMVRSFKTIDDTRYYSAWSAVKFSQPVK
ncbi:MAG: Ig domain-containing protein [Clostridiales Family XIII bacterium]|jgi:hypothetical protein|nr:Ig domain-containing protein [Clostridiales Family XIII bacterium]